MKLFGFFKKEEKGTFRITEPDRLWVDDNFRWLIKVFGYPYRESEQILLSENYFPNTFTSDKVLIENIFKDLSSLLQISEDKVSFELVKDIRDSYSMPYAIEGKPFETELKIEEGKYKIYIANSLQNYPKRLIYNLVYEYISIRLTDNKLQFDTGNDTGLFVYLAGIYFGFGILLSQNLKDTGREDDGSWETKWSYISEMPTEVMAYALATYSKLIDQCPPNWKNGLPLDLKNQYEKAIQYLTDNPSELYNRKELEANELFKKANDQYLKNEFKEAIIHLQKILLLTNDDMMMADVYNNLGYYHLRLKNYEQSVENFKKSIQILPDYGCANDNLGYTLIQLGKLEDGKEWLEKAMETKTNDIAYTYRNWALYYQARGELSKAEDFFKKSFDSITGSVDFLEYHYAVFLIQIGKKDDGLEFLKRAIEKGEYEAIEKMNEIKEKQP